jgi:hypothetical protein
VKLKCFILAEIKEVFSTKMSTIVNKRARDDGSQLKTRKVVYCTSDYCGQMRGPSYGRFFSEFPKSSGGVRAKDILDGLEKVSLQLTWLLNQPSSVLLSTSSTGKYTVWTVAVDEPVFDNDE